MVKLLFVLLWLFSLSLDVLVIAGAPPGDNPSCTAFS